MNGLFPVSGWQDVAAIVTVLTVPLILVSVYAAFRQIRTQADTSRRELSFNAIIALNDKFERSARDYRSLVERFNNGDRTVNMYSAQSVFTAYWSVIADEWTFFENGLVTPNTLTGWCMLAYAHTANEISLSYFDAGGESQRLGSRDVFEKVVLNGRYRHWKSFHAFYAGLASLKAEKMPDGVIPEDARPEVISRYVHRFVREHGIKALKI